MKNNMTMAAVIASAAPTPIPALAPVERPVDSFDDCEETVEFVELGSEAEIWDVLPSPELDVELDSYSNVFNTLASVSQAMVAQYTPMWNPPVNQV
jgi:hypothetical protein